METTYIADEQLDWTIEKAIVVRTKNDWDTPLVGDYRGCVVAIIPYQSKEGRRAAIAIAEQIKTNVNLKANAIA